MTPTQTPAAAPPFGGDRPAAATPIGHRGAAAAAGSILPGRRAAEQLLDGVPALLRQQSPRWDDRTWLAVRAGLLATPQARAEAARLRGVAR